MTMVEALIEEASLYTASDPDRARRMLTRALAVKPWIGRIHHLLGITESDDGNSESAARYLETATALEPYNPQYWYDFGVLEFYRENMELACHHFERALTLRTDYIDAIFNLGLCYFFTDDTIAAAAAMKLVIHFDPTGKRRVKAESVVESLGTNRRGLRSLLQRIWRRDSPSAALTSGQQLLHTQNMPPDRAVVELSDLLASLDDKTRSYHIVAQYLSYAYFSLNQYYESYRLSLRAKAELPCVRSLTMRSFSQFIIEPGKEHDAKRIYAQMVARLFGVEIGFVAFTFDTWEGSSASVRTAHVSVEQGTYEILRGGNIFLITTPNGQEIEHQEYDRSDRVLGIW